MNGKELRTIIYDCPFCEKEHTLKVIQYPSKTMIKGEEVEYIKTAYLCEEYDEEFVPAGIMDSNLNAAREAYRIKMNYLTADDIKRVRKKYDLTQREYARLLGVGDATIQRYETKAIQDSTYDMLMRMTDENPSCCLSLLEKNKDSFEETRYQQIKRNIAYQIRLYGVDFFLEAAIKSKYVDFDEASDKNGYHLLNIEKVKSLLIYFSTYIHSLYKVKLMKLLWYADAEFYREYGHSITGLVYRHMPLGAVPIAHNEIMALSCIRVEEEIHDCYTAYRIYPEADINIKEFTIEELGVLQRVTEKFSAYSTKEIVEYMHEENAYKNSADNEIILFSKENMIRSFS